MRTDNFCKWLRTKGMFIQPATDEAPAQPDTKSAGSSHCWCNCTLTETGPDDRPVGFDVCDSSRPCFEE